MDGVSDSMLEKVLCVEVPGIEIACLSLGFEATMTFVIIEKGNNIRFYL